MFSKNVIMIMARRSGLGAKESHKGICINGDYKEAKQMNGQVESEAAHNHND